jgi:aminoglycoside 3-N-acetyltransferase
MTTTPPPPITRRQLHDDLAGLGLSTGDVVLVHAAMSRIGWVLGGAVAVVQALLDVVGRTGTIVVPTGTAGNCDPARWGRTLGKAVPEPHWQAIRDQLPAFDPAVTPSTGMGAIAEAVREWPAAMRSTHPQSSFAALGPQARYLTEIHDRDCHLGERSPLGRLAEMNASVLLLGVDYDVCTAFHLAEYRQKHPGTRDYECVVLDPKVGRTWFYYEDVDLRADDFAVLGKAFETSPGGKDCVRIGSVGSSTARLLPFHAAVTFATQWMPANRSLEHAETGGNLRSGGDGRARSVDEDAPGTDDQSAS